MLLVSVQFLFTKIIVNILVNDCNALLVKNHDRQQLFLSVTGDTHSRQKENRGIGLLKDKRETLH